MWNVFFEKPPRMEVEKFIKTSHADQNRPENYRGGGNDKFFFEKLKESTLSLENIKWYLPTPWLTLLLVLGKSRGKQNLC